MFGLCAEKGYSKRELETEVRRVRANEKTSKGGRPADPAFVKSIRRFAKLLENPEESFGELDRVADLSGKVAAELYRSVTGMKLRCVELQKALEAKVPGFRATDEEVA